MAGTASLFGAATASVSLHAVRAHSSDDLLLGVAASWEKDRVRRHTVELPPAEVTALGTARTHSRNIPSRIKHIANAANAAKVWRKRRNSATRCRNALWQQVPSARQAMKSMLTASALLSARARLRPSPWTSARRSAKRADATGAVTRVRRPIGTPCASSRHFRWRSNHLATAENTAKVRRSSWNDAKMPERIRASENVREGGHSPCAHVALLYFASTSASARRRLRLWLNAASPARCWRYFSPTYLPSAWRALAAPS